MRVELLIMDFLMLSATMSLECVEIGLGPNNYNIICNPSLALHNTKIYDLEVHFTLNTVLGHFVLLLRVVSFGDNCMNVNKNVQTLLATERWPSNSSFWL